MSSVSSLLQKKKEQGAMPCSKNCVDPISPQSWMRARAPPETWTTRLKPCGQPEPELVAHLSAVVIILSNDCSNFEQFLK
jgi:hypothetical protein